MLYHGYIGEYPKDRESGWSDNLQGVTHDDENWFFTQETELWRFPVTHDLNKKETKEDPSRGILQVNMPETLWEEGYDHFGDLDCFDDYLFIPITGHHQQRFFLNPPPPPRIAVFSARNLEYIGSSVLEEQSGAGWCAINPQNHLLYTSESTISSSNPIYTYEVDFDQLKNSLGHAPRRGGRVILDYKEPYRIYDEYSNLLKLEHMQGGVFSNDGHLYIVNGYYKDFNPKDGGVSVFNVETGERVAKSTSGHDPFNYEFHPGWSKYEEPEGITLWDLDDGRAPHIRGQLHVIMLDNDAFTDDLYFKHYVIREAPYIANKNPSCREVHKAECIWVGKMALYNRVPYLGLWQAFDDGYDGCFYCLNEHHSR